MPKNAEYKDLETIQKEMKRFIETRWEEVRQANKEGTPEDEREMMCRLCEQVRLFWREHGDETPERLEKLLHLVCTMLHRDKTEREHAIRELVMQGVLPLSKMPGGIFVDPCPHHNSICGMIKQVMDMGRSDLSWAVEALKKGMDKVLEAIWPEYKERWKD